MVDGNVAENANVKYHLLGKKAFNQLAIPSSEFMYQLDAAASSLSLRLLFLSVGGLITSCGGGGFLDFFCYTSQLGEL